MLAWCSESHAGGLTIILVESSNLLIVASRLGDDLDHDEVAGILAGACGCDEYEDFRLLLSCCRT